jgi:pyridoxal phosphate enzyme (YggS family)
MSTLEARYQAIQHRIHQACDQVGRSRDSVRLLAVSKTKPATMVRQCYQLGQRAFGENYLQDGIDKVESLRTLDGLQWHFIGPLQSNKTRPVATHFDWLETLDRDKIARRLNEQRPQHLPPLQVLVQVNISGEEQKAGVPVADVMRLAEHIQTLERLNLRGLMCIPEATDLQSVDGVTTLKQQFQQMKHLFEQLKTVHTQVDTLSMGMSADLELAIEAGATEIRIGTDIFGARSPR